VATCCDEIREDVPWVAAGGASSDQSARVALHLVRCADCRRELAREIALRERLRQAAMAVPGPGEAVWRKVAGRLERETDSPPERHWVLTVLGVCGTPALAIKVLEGALSPDAERPVREWLRPWVRLARAAL